MGGIYSARRVAEELAPRLTERLLADSSRRGAARSRLTRLSSVRRTDRESVSSRQAFPTLCMSSALDITRRVNPPRAAFLDFPLGHTTGKPHEPGSAASDPPRRTRRVSLAPRTRIGEASCRFAGPTTTTWKRDALGGGDDRQPRYDTPQYQAEEDRLRAEACGVCAHLTIIGPSSRGAPRSASGDGGSSTCTPALYSVFIHTLPLRSHAVIAPSSMPL